MPPTFSFSVSRLSAPINRRVSIFCKGAVIEFDRYRGGNKLARVSSFTEDCCVGGQKFSRDVFGGMKPKEVFDGDIGFHNVERLYSYDIGIH